MSDIEMCRDLIQEAKGVEGPNGGFVTDHLDTAEVWLDKVEATVEAQAAEIERLRELIKVTGDHWLALQHKHPIQWEGAIDGAMAAACAEIEKLRVAVKDIQIEAEREKGNWTHLKQVIARKAHAALAGKAEQ